MAALPQCAAAKPLSYTDGIPNRNLTQRSHDALENTVLQGALKAATDTFIERRRDAITSVSDWKDCVNARGRLRHIRSIISITISNKLLRK